MGIVRFALRFPHTFYLVAALILFLGVAATAGGKHRQILQKITIARDFGKEVEVHDGVKPGDQAILSLMVDLVDGSKVAV